MAASRRRYVRHMPKIYGNLQKPSRSWAWIGRSAVVLLWSAVGGAAVYWVAFSGFFSVHKVEIEGDLLVSKAEISSTVSLGSPIWLVSSDQIRSRLLADPKVKAVSVYRGLPDSIRIVVQEKQPALMWTSGPTTAVLDDQGQAFLLADAAHPLPSAIDKTTRLVDTKGLPVQLGSRPAVPEFIAFASAVKKNLAALLPEASLDHLEIADTTYDLTLVMKQGMRVQCSTLGDPAVQMRNLARLVHQKKASLNSQVDLRIDRWAYVT